MIDVNIEDTGLNVLLAGMKHPAFTDNPLFEQLAAALALEKTSREMSDTTRKPVELPNVGTLSNRELREAAGFLYGLLCQIDVERYQRTFAFCFALFAVLVEEINLRAPAGEGVTVH